MENNKNFKPFWVACQTGVRINSPLSCNFSPSPPKSENIKVVYKNKQESSKSIIDPLTWLAVGMAL